MNAHTLRIKQWISCIASCELYHYATRMHSMVSSMVNTLYIAASGTRYQRACTTRMAVFWLGIFYLENYFVSCSNDCFKRKSTPQNGYQVSPRLCQSKFRQNQEAGPRRFTPCTTSQLVVPLNMFQMLVPLAGI
jgi:hypothetical protein